MSAWRMECASSRPGELVCVGDTVAFSVMVYRDDSPNWGGTVEWTLRAGEARRIQQGTLTLTPGENRVRIVVDASGAWQCRFRVAEQGLECAIGVLADGDKLQPALPEPENYDAFWHEQLRRLAEIPLHPVRNLRPVSGGLRCGELSGDCVRDQPARGELWLPERAGRGSLPGVILFHGAGVRSAGQARTAAWAERGFLALELPAHGLELYRVPEFYGGLATGKLAEYHRLGLAGDDPAGCYFLTMFLRAKRVVDLLAAQPEWDGRNLFVTGGSQGGWQALAAAALDARISAAGVWIPAGCDIMRGNWPCCGPREEEEKRESLYRKVLPFFDATNLTPRIKVPLGIFAGLADPVCHPDGVAAARNRASAGHVQMVWYPTVGHEDNAVVIDAVEAFLSGQLKSELKSRRDEGSK